MTLRLTSLFLALTCISPVAAQHQTNALPTIEQTAREFYGSERARETLMKFPSRGERTDTSIPPKTPVATVGTFKLMEGLEAEVVLHEPVVRQPVFLNFDERGRMWVVQFLQYPYPAGVKVIDFDDQFHAVYDKVPPPPPHHDRGADKITIHEDRDGDGTFETHKVFLDGLNMVTAVERGRGGVWVLNPPYLVFWPDRNNDDVPDGDPTIHLAGFGLEDTHSAANSLRWGPDAWLYGTQGSGVSSRIKRPGLDQGEGMYFKGQVVWRYHPETRAFELFAEGGGNTFCLEFDAAGRAWSGINGGGHRGFHFVQGGYYSKNFGEHGYFTNPHTFGHLNAMPHEPEAPRFSHTFVIYEGGALGAEYEGRMIAPVPLHHHVMLTELRPTGSSYATRDVGQFLSSSDRWFRPVDVKTGPDGAVYIADWYDTRLSHMDPRDTWDRAHGRIYRVRRKNGAKATAKFDLASVASDKLVDLLSHSNKWHRQTALRVIADRRDSRLTARLAGLAADRQNPRALDSLWALHASGGFEAATAQKLLSHPQPLVRLWTLRLAGETWQTSLPDPVRRALMAMVETETDPQVRSQLASTARRLNGDIAVDVIFTLARRGADAGDPHIPLLLWWGLEAHAISHRSSILQKMPWAQLLVREQLLPRLARLYATVPTTENQQALATLLRAAPNAEARSAIMRGINEAFKGGSADTILASLEEALETSGGSGPRDPVELALAVRRGETRAVREALALILSEGAAADGRVAVIEALSESRQEAAVTPLLQILSHSRDNRVRQSALTALGRFDSGEIAREILARWAHLDTTLKRGALGVLCSRKSWAKEFLLAAGASGTISKADVPNDIALRLRLFRDKELDDLCDRYFGRLAGATTAEKQKQIERITKVVQGPTNADLKAGKELFIARCATCHMLFGEGQNIGPDLTGAERTNLENMLLGIVDPSVAVREGFTLFRFQLKDGRDLVGFITNRDGNQITLRDAVGQVATFPTSLVEKEQTIATSIMPEGLLDDLQDQPLRDLFGYLMRQAGN
jgi:putative membrane-bound dehydrogenase-like protein